MSKPKRGKKSRKDKPHKSASKLLESPGPAQPDPGFFSPKTGQTEHGQAEIAIDLDDDQAPELEDDPDEALEPEYDIRENDGPELEPDADDPRYSYKWPGTKEVARVLRRCNGNLRAAAKALDVSRTTLYDWLQKNPALEKVRTEGTECRLDLLEEKMDELIEGVKCVKHTKKGDIVYKRAPNFGAIRFLAETLGKHRGYVIKGNPPKSTTGPDLADRLFEKLEEARAKFHAPTQENSGLQQGTD